MVACGGDAVAEVDVFDGRKAVARVEAAGVEECVALDDAAACPEGAGVAVGVLVGEVVEEIAVAGDETLVSGSGVVGAEGGGGVGVGIQGAAGREDEVWGDADIGVDEEDELAGGGGGTGVAGGGDARSVSELDGLEAAGGGGGVD